MKKMILAIALLVTVAVPSAVKAAAVDDLNAMINTASYLQNDFATIAGFLASEFAAQVPFNATMGSNFPANVCGFPGVGFGGTVGASFGTVNIEGFKSLKLTYLPDAVDPGNLQIPNPMPIPSGSIHIMTGLIGTPAFKMDFGIRFLPLDLKIDSSDATVAIKYNIFGLETRAQILEDSLLSPFGLVGMLSLDWISGMLDVRSKGEYADKNISINSTTYDVTVSGTNLSTTDWTIQSLGLKLILNKSLAFFNPYLGAGINVNMGTVNSALGTEGDVKLFSPGTQTVLAQAKTAVIGRKNVTPPFGFKLIAGFELSPIPFTKFFFGYEWGGQIYGLSGGLRFQIP